MANELNPERQNPEEAAGEDIVKYWRSALNHKWLILMVTAIALVFSTFRYYRMPDYYNSSARILVHKVDTAPQPYTEMAAPRSSDPSYYMTQVEILKGLQVCRQVAQNLGLSKHYGAASEAAAANILRGSIASSLIRNTQILTVSVTDRDPEWAAKIVNEVSDVFIKESMKDRLFVSEQILKWFPNESKGVQGSTAMELLKQIDDEKVVDKLPSVANDPAIKKLKQEKIDLAGRMSELLTRYTPEHPQVKELVGRVEYIDGEIRGQTDKLIGALKTALAGEFNVSNLKVLERGAVPGSPSGPNRKKGIIMFTLMALAGSIALSVFMDSLDKTIKSDEDILGIPGLPFLGNVPLMADKKAKQKTGTKSLEELVTTGTIADAMTSLNTALMFSMPKGQNKLIMVTSALPGEGKTTVSYLLALSMAKLGNRVLYVELDLRRPSLHEKVGGDNASKKGIADYLVGQANFEEITQKSTTTQNLDVVFAGSISPNPTTLFTSSAFDDFIKMVEQKYDRIVFDTPPALQIPDPVILSNKMHGVVFLIGAGMVHRKIAVKTIMKFRFVGSVIFGAIINLVNYNKPEYGSYHYYYNKYYGKAGK